MPRRSLPEVNALDYWDKLRLTEPRPWVGRRAGSGHSYFIIRVMKGSCSMALMMN